MLYLSSVTVSSQQSKQTFVKSVSFLVSGQLIRWANISGHLLGLIVPAREHSSKRRQEHEMSQGRAWLRHIKSTFPCHPKISIFTATKVDLKLPEFFSPSFCYSASSRDVSKKQLCASHAWRRHIVWRVPTRKPSPDPLDLYLSKQTSGRQPISLAPFLSPAEDNCKGRSVISTSVQLNGMVVVWKNWFFFLWKPPFFFFF